MCTCVSMHTNPIDYISWLFNLLWYIHIELPPFLPLLSCLNESTDTPNTDLHPQHYFEDVTVNSQMYTTGNSYQQLEVHDKGKLWLGSTLSSVDQAEAHHDVTEQTHQLIPEIPEKGQQCTLCFVSPNAGTPFFTLNDEGDYCAAPCLCEVGAVEFYQHDVTSQSN